MDKIMDEGAWGPKIMDEGEIVDNAEKSQDYALVC